MILSLLIFYIKLHLLQNRAFSFSSSMISIQFIEKHFSCTQRLNKALLMCLNKDCLFNLSWPTFQIVFEADAQKLHQ